MTGWIEIRKTTATIELELATDSNREDQDGYFGTGYKV